MNDRILGAAGEAYHFITDAGDDRHEQHAGGDALDEIRPARKAKTKIDTTMTMSRKFVPHRGWRRLWRLTFSTVNSSPDSYVQMVLCSAPWYSKTRRMSDVREIPHIYNRNIARRRTPSTTFRRTALSATPGMNFAAYVGMARKKTIARTTETEMLVETVVTAAEGTAPVIIDIGTGSGAIVLSLLHYLPQATGTGVDISTKALAIAAEMAVPWDSTTA